MQTVSKFLPMGYLVEGMKDVMVRGEGPQAALVPDRGPAGLRRGDHVHRHPAVQVGHRLTEAGARRPAIRRSRRPPAGPW